jgi:hypothetical protein
MSMVGPPADQQAHQHQAEDLAAMAGEIRQGAEASWGHLPVEGDCKTYKQQVWCKQAGGMEQHFTSWHAHQKYVKTGLTTFPVDM